MEQTLDRIELADAVSALRWTVMPWGFFVTTMHGHCEVMLTATNGPPWGWGAFRWVTWLFSGGSVLLWLALERWPALDARSLGRIVTAIRIGYLLLLCCALLTASAPEHWIPAMLR